jgi:hypothetical protein
LVKYDWDESVAKEPDTADTTGLRTKVGLILEAKRLSACFWPSLAATSHRQSNPNQSYILHSVNAWPIAKPTETE